MRPLVFVFGSNLLGKHGSGSAKFARDHYGAVYGEGRGFMGSSYALPTCSAPGVPLSLEKIAKEVIDFEQFARQNPDKDFLLTAVGCGLAGYSTEVIARLFTRLPDNVYMQAKLAYGLGGLK